MVSFINRHVRLGSVVAAAVALGPLGSTRAHASTILRAQSVIAAPGTTFGLGHVLFDVAPNAVSGSFAVDFAFFPFTSLSDDAGVNVPIDTLVSGLITISSPANPVVPEPSSLSMLFSGAAAWAVMM